MPHRCAIDELCTPTVVGPDEMGGIVDAIDAMGD
jgi:hypothetical protein